MAPITPSFPVYVLVDCTMEPGTKRIHASVKKSIDLLSEALKQEKHKEVKLAFIRLNEGPGKRLTPEKIVHRGYKPPTFRPSSEDNLDLYGALSIAVTQIQEAKNNSEAAQKENFQACVALLVTGDVSQDAAKLNATLSHLRDLIGDVLVVQCGQGRLSDRGLQVTQMNFQDFEAHADGVIQNWLNQNHSQAVSRMANVLQQVASQPTTQHRVQSVLQDMVNAAKVGDCVSLLPKEYAGPIVIDREMTIDGKGATIWALRGPVVKITAPNVMLKNVRIELTGAPAGDELEDSPFAVVVTDTGSVVTYQVNVRGGVKGITTDDGVWKYPSSVHVGQIPARTDYEVRLVLDVPVPCGISTSVSGVEISPKALVAGRNEVQIRVDGMPDDTLIYGHISITTENFIRSIVFRGDVKNSPEPIVQGKIIWQPETSPPHLPSHEEELQTEQEEASIQQAQAEVLAALNEVATTADESSVTPSLEEVLANRQDVASYIQQLVQEQVSKIIGSTPQEAVTTPAEPPETVSDHVVNAGDDPTPTNPMSTPGPTMGLKKSVPQTNNMAENKENNASVQLSQTSPSVQPQPPQLNMSSLFGCIKSKPVRQSTPMKQTEFIGDLFSTKITGDQPPLPRQTPVSPPPNASGKATTDPAKRKVVKSVVSNVFFDKKE